MVIQVASISLVYNSHRYVFKWNVSKVIQGKLVKRLFYKSKCFNKLFSNINQKAFYEKKWISFDFIRDAVASTKQHILVNFENI